MIDPIINKEYYQKKKQFESDLNSQEKLIKEARRYFHDYAGSGYLGINDMTSGDKRIAPMIQFFDQFGLVFDHPVKLIRKSYLYKSNIRFFHSEKMDSLVLFQLHSEKILFYQ